MSEEALPNILALFLKFDETYFDSQLRKDCFVEWSSRMFVCAGICSHGAGEKFCTIRLSKPLLKLRPRSDLVETLLHEMIHAFLFIKERNYDRDGHGPQFHSHMHRINRKGGYNISVYHEFHDEVDSYKTHVWRCEGSCQNNYPYFGYVKRTANRPPGRMISGGLEYGQKGGIESAESHNRHVFQKAESQEANEDEERCCSETCEKTTTAKDYSG